MLKFSGFPFKKIALLCAAMGGFVFFSSEANAQEENSPRPIEKPVVEDQGSNQDNTTAVFPLFKPTGQKPTSPSSVKRDLPAGGFFQEKEAKKNEAPSTLSFNIFLYIVDKFKED
jgi:hypothetical protein